MKLRLNPKTKSILSLLSVLILILAFLLVPKINKSAKDNYINNQPNYSVRRVPAETISPVPENELLIINSQPPSNKLIIIKADFKEGGYMKIFKDEEEIGRSEILTGVQENLDITLMKESEEGDMLKAVLYDKQDALLSSENVLIITTTITPGFILPKDLQ